MSHRDPATIITKQHCGQIIKNYNKCHKKDFKMLSYAVASAEEAKGFLGEYFRLAIMCWEPTQSENEELPHEEALQADENFNHEITEENALKTDDATLLKFFIKKLPLVHEEHEKVVIFRKEGRLYSTLLAELLEYSPHLWCPKVYLSSSHLLVLEDLDELGYHSLTNKETLKVEEMLPILKGLAAMHASSILYELYDKSIEDNYAECLKEITVHPDIPWFQVGLKALLEVAKIHPRYQAEESQKFIEQELPYHLRSLYFMVNPSPKYRNVVCHRDSWGGNIFINSEDSEASAIFVDFQTCRYCPPIIDVIFTLFLNLSKEERVAKEKSYLEYYWQQLQFYTKSDKESDVCLGLNETDFWESYEEFKLIGYVYRALAKSILEVPTEMVDENYKNVDRTEPLLSYLEDNEEFQEIMFECVEDIVEAVVEMSLMS
ncbi:uncharacterized protein LOC106081210 [Stomoxys calcitrans]|uniref:CHK kinase-like domain-containing protein n=1 Tax=Stomoxys calcitrans TaxID=35570 RepID=A0A1I8PX45_STOCA|nr:uncharacterized protein LOC106081210 [Stomoxys calcitrans]